MSSASYVVSQGKISAVTAGRISATGVLPFNGGAVVSAGGIYTTSRSDMGGPRPGVPVTLTLQRLDRVTLAVSATTTETVAAPSPSGFASTPGISAAVLGKNLFTTIGSCPTAPTTDTCVQRRDPVTLAVLGSVLRASGPDGSESALGQSTDGTVTLTLRGATTNTQQIDLLGNGPTG